ncbi:MAG: hypothetical protein JNK05_23625 [Myxococcales bacterium]|nr:hypothetical protein [Myxococcales bacterium]
MGQIEVFYFDDSFFCGEEKARRLLLRTNDGVCTTVERGTEDRSTVEAGFLVLRGTWLLGAGVPGGG